MGIGSVGEGVNYAVEGEIWSKREVGPGCGENVEKKRCQPVGFGDGRRFLEAADGTFVLKMDKFCC